MTKITNADIIPALDSHKNKAMTNVNRISFTGMLPYLLLIIESKQKGIPIHMQIAKPEG